MTSAAQEQKRFDRFLIFGLVNGPIVYSLHFLVVYFLVEGSCKSGFVRREIFGFGVVSVAIVVLTVLATAIVLFGGYVSYRGWRRSKENAERGQDAYSRFMAVAGMWLNGYFGLLILLTGLPVLLLVFCDWI
jgi:hypothetical protein